MRLPYLHTPTQPRRLYHSHLDAELTELCLRSDLNKQVRHVILRGNVKEGQLLLSNVVLQQVHADINVLHSSRLLDMERGYWGWWCVTGSSAWVLRASHTRGWARGRGAGLEAGSVTRYGCTCLDHTLAHCLCATLSALGGTTERTRRSGMERSGMQRSAQWNGAEHSGMERS
eukprot:363523-Chlamydomonas_euryale.AAC.2